MAGQRVFQRMMCVLPVVAGLVGCATEADTRSFQQQRVIKDADADAVLAQATVILRREFGSARVNPAARHIETEWAEFTTQHESGTARDLYRGRSTMRHMATCDVGQRGGATVARLRIDVQRQDTERQAVMQPQGHRLSDAPGHETPIDRDAATTYRQNTVWTSVRRDTKLERALLEELREHFARLVAEVEPAGTEPENPEPGAADAPATPGAGD